MFAGTVYSLAAGPREWDAIVGDRFIVAIGAPASESIVGALAELAGDPGATLERIIARLPLGGSDAVSDFAVAWWEFGSAASAVTVVVRGDAVVDLASVGGIRRFDSLGIHPWHLAAFDRVRSLRVTTSAASLDGLGAGSRVPHARATFRAGAVEWSAVERAADQVDGSPRDDLGTPLDPPPTVAPSDTVRTPMIVPASAAVPALPVRSPAPAPVPRVTVPAPITAPAAPAAPSVTEPASPMRRPVRRGLQPVDLSALADRGPAVPVPSQELPPGSPSAAMRHPLGHGAQFRVGSTGPGRSIGDSVLIGRNPRRPRIDGALVELVSVPSPRSKVSGTHLELRTEGDRLVAVDLDSRNGTVLVAGGRRRRLRPREAIVVAPGTLLELGGDTIIEILPSEEPTE